MAYCINCGRPLDNNAKFCNECGARAEQKQTHQEKVYDGTIHKCPNCGEILNTFITVCPTCGYELRDTSASSSVREFVTKIENAVNESEKINIISNFPISNSKEDIFEFLFLASSNFDVVNYVSNSNNDRNIANAWLAKIEQCKNKANNINLPENDLAKINEICNEINQRIEQARIGYEKKEFSQKTAAETNLFKKSKLRIIIILFMAFSLISCAISFNKEKVLAGIVAVVISLLFSTALLMGNGIIKSKIHNVYLIPTILAFFLIIPFFKIVSLPVNDANKEEVELISWDNFILSKNLPDFGANEASVVWDTEDVFIVHFFGVSKAEYESYIQDCINFGYTIDSEEDGSNYLSFNEDGYYLCLAYGGKQSNRCLAINLMRPIKREKIAWPKSDLIKKVPKPDSLIGEVTSESSEEYTVYLVDTDIVKMEKYVKKCIKKGFEINYSKSDTLFYAENGKGVSLKVQYMGFNIMCIQVEQLY